jgi:hypothetical protein
MYLRVTSVQPTVVWPLLSNLLTSVRVGVILLGYVVM